MGFAVLIACVFLFVAFDELQQHCEENKFKVIPGGSWWRNLYNKATVWLNEDVAWKRKHRWKPTWLFSTALVWVTDGEHFFQMLKSQMFLAYFIASYFFPVPLLWGVAVFLATYFLSRFLWNEVILK